MIDMRNTTLADHPFLSDISPKLIAVLERLVRRANFTAGQLIGREGVPAAHFYLVESGHVGIETHTASRGSVRIQTVGPGEAIGWSWLLAPHRWQFDARAVDSVSAFEFGGKELREQCEADCEFGYQFTKRLVAVVASRLAATRIQLLDVYQ